MAGAVEKGSVTMTPMMNRNGSLRFCSLALAAASLLPLGCAADDVSDAIATETSAIVIGHAGRIETVPAPARIQTEAAGLSADDYHDEWARLTGLGYVPVTLSSVKLPDSGARFSSVFVKDRNIRTFFSQRGMTDAEYEQIWAEKRAAGYRVLDVTGRPTSDGTVFDGVWVKEREAPDAWGSYRGLTTAQLQAKLTEEKADGKAPIRIHGYPTGGGTRFTGVWAKDEIGTDYRVVLDKSSDDYATAYADAVADGYDPFDISVYQTASGNLRYTGVFRKNSLGIAAASWRNMSAESFQKKRVELADKDYVMVDLEVASSDADDDKPVYAAIWQHRGGSGPQASFSLSDAAQATWSAPAKAALQRIKDRAAAFDGRVGFVIDDLTNGQYLGMRVNDPFYLASTTKVFIAATILDRVAAGTLSLTQNINYVASDILDTGATNPTNPQLPITTGNQTIEQSLKWMINQSSTNATDRLMRLVTPAAVNTYLEQSGIVDVGEITAICELDKRIYESDDACVRGLSCVTFENWLRSKVTPTGAAKTCTDKLTRSANWDRSHLYYASRANTATPMQYARLWRRILEADILTPAMRDKFIEIATGTGQGYMKGLEGTYYDQQAGKFGSKPFVSSWVGVGYDQTGAAGVADDTAQYSIGIFTERNVESDAAEDAAEKVMDDMVKDALIILEDRR
jgi:hypothetical protein